MRRELAVVVSRVVERLACGPELHRRIGRRHRRPGDSGWGMTRRRAGGGRRVGGLLGLGVDDPLSLIGGDALGVTLRPGVSNSLGPVIGDSLGPLEGDSLGLAVGEEVGSSSLRHTQC